MKDYEADREKSAKYKSVLDAALQELEEHRERERQRQKNIEAMYDGEARQINEKQDKVSHTLYIFVLVLTLTSLP